MTRLMSEVQAVIFDMDGLMLDTERLALVNFQIVSVELGFPSIEDVYLRTIGRNAPDTREIFMQAMGPAFPFDAMRERWRSYNDEEMSSSGVAQRPGLTKLLDAIDRAGVPKAVATSTAYDKAVQLLTKVDLLHRFVTLVGGDQVQKGKPDPEIFLTAAQRMNVNPGQCLVFEDSGPGIRAAHSAGMMPVLVPDLVMPPPDVQALAVRIYQSLDEAIELIGEN